MKKKIVLAIIIIIIDQLVKLALFNTIGKADAEITIIPNFLTISYIENFGAAFGFFQERILLIGIDILLICTILKIIFNKNTEIDEKAKLGFFLIIAGGLSNLIDRIFRGYVIDYIDINKFVNFAVFNLADISIVFGVIFILLIIVINTIRSQEKVNEKI